MVWLVAAKVVYIVVKMRKKVMVIMGFLEFSWWKRRRRRWCSCWKWRRRWRRRRWRTWWRNGGDGDESRWPRREAKHQ